MPRDHIRHTRKRVRREDVDCQPPPSAEVIASSPPQGKKKVNNIYYDPDTKEIVIETED